MGTHAPSNERVMKFSGLILLVTPGFHHTIPSTSHLHSICTVPIGTRNVLLPTKQRHLVLQNSLHTMAILFPGGITTLLLNFLYLPPILFPSYNQGKHSSVWLGGWVYRSLYTDVYNPAVS